MSDFRPSGFSVLPTVVKNLLIINLIFFLAKIAADTTLDYLTKKEG